MSETSSILQVALKAGVSQATVSRVLNQSAPVAAATVATVMKCVRDLGYAAPQRKRRHAAARPASAAKKKIAVVGIGEAGAGWLDVPVIARAVMETAKAAREQGFGVMLEHVSEPSQLGRGLKDEDIAGAVVWLSSNRDPGILNELGRELPIVRAMGDQIAPMGVDHVSANSRQVGALARQYLEAQGCEDVIFLSASPQWDLIRNRGDGFFQAAKPHRRDDRSILVTSAQFETFERRPATCCPTWEAAADAIVEGPRRPVGLFTARDYEAAQIYPLLAARGVRLGSEVVVVSCDNDPTWLAGLSPRPASVDLVCEAVGRQALLRLMTRIERPADPIVQILLSPWLNVPGGKPAVSSGEKGASGSKAHAMPGALRAR